jgi:hypothetical protein
MTKRKRLIAVSPTGWRLHHLLDYDRPGWRNFHLQAPWHSPWCRTRPRSTFWLGWNGERLARCTDQAALATSHPALHQWTIDALRDSAAALGW